MDKKFVEMLKFQRNKQSSHLNSSNSNHTKIILMLFLSLPFLLQLIVQNVQGMETESTIKSGRPYLRDTMQSPVHVVEGENAPLTCVVRNLGNSTVVWKKWETGKEGSTKILTAGDTRVTSDERVRIIHDEGGDVWVLAIQSSKPTDSGLYICEVNSNPILRSFHNLTVISLSIQPPNTSFTVPAEGEDIPFDESYSSYKRGSIDGHNYTSCCQSMNISKDCLGFCTLSSILEGKTGDPTLCENEFPSIVKCMADGRDHTGCCIRESVPDICQDLCRGEYTTVTDNVKTHFSCPTYIERTLSCIADGIEILPSEPQNLEAFALNSSSINVTWMVPAKNGDTITDYIVNVTTLRTFDPPYTGDHGYGLDTPEASPQIQNQNQKFDFKDREGFPFVHPREPGKPEDSGSSKIPLSTTTTKKPVDPDGKTYEHEDKELSAEDKVETKMMQIKVHPDLTSTLITDLRPFTMYEISVKSFNIHGGSLPSYKVRILTLPPGLSRPDPVSAPEIPDIRSCCVKKGVSSEMCVEKLCDPKKATSIEIPDLMVCAPWTPDVFACLADQKDHTPCCLQRGITAPCSDLCSGNVTRLDYHYFKCLRYMSEYSNCLMEGYGVLPSSPRKVRVSNVQEDFAIVHWSPPDKLKDTVTGYNVHFRPLSTFENEYHVAHNVHTPFILEELYNNAEYEVYVEAVNEHGESQASPRVVFRTADMHEELAELEEETNAYNETACCIKAGMSQECLPLCNYDASMSDIRTLALGCAPEFHTLLKCAAGGRDHSQCCARRGVTESCIDICSARVTDSLLSLAETCLPFIGNIVQCFEEGTDLIPGPVAEFHAVFITDSSVALSWEPPANSNVSAYEVYYHMADPSITHEVAFQSKSINVTSSSVEVENLTRNSVYQFYVVARNEHGSSIPSAMVLVNVSAESFNGTKIPGILSAPHSLVVASHSATYVQIVWQPPQFSHPEDKITYKVYHRGVKEQGNNVTETFINSISLEDLSPNTQYIVYVTAVNDKGESPPSETLIAWSDPAHSPFVEPPRIQPMNALVEGKSMTVFCVALGDPTPTISLYINGKLIKSEKNRHLTQTIDNISREFEIVSCYADNGYGTPMQAARKIQVSYAPSIHGSEMNFASIGDTATILCTVDAYPEPKVAFWKSDKDKSPIVSGIKYQIDLDDNHLELRNKYNYKLKISNVSQDDVSKYFCHAENHFGDFTKEFNLQVRKSQDLTGNITECCVQNKVSSGCLDACGFYLDIEAVIDRPECIGDFDKLMKCAADSRDHRSCCSSWGVPKRCLDWCRGEPLLQNGELCVLSNTKAILQCFQENRDLLPGPPQKLKFEVLSDNEIKLSWSPPVINPQAALIYRVFWRVLNSKMSEKVDTQGLFVRLDRLKPGSTYEAFVKAGNHHGTSILSEQIIFATEDNTISSARSAGSSTAGLGVGLAFLILFLIAGVVGAVWFVRKRQFGAKPANGAIAFENPSYIRESNPDASLQHTNGELSSSTTTSNGGVASVSNRSNGSAVNGWHTEMLQTPLRTETEVPPTFYEELRLGSDGAGFRRLKP